MKNSILLYMRTELFTRVFVLTALFFSLIRVDAQVIPDSALKTKQLEQGGSKEGDKKKDKETGKPDKCIKKFKTLTDTYYGYPNFFGYILQIAVSHPTTVSSIGPTGGKFEFLLTDKFGIGTDISYSTASVTWTEIKPDQNNMNVLYHHKFSSTAFRSMASFNFHFHTRKRVDWYTSLKTGYFNRTYNYTSDDPTSKAPAIDQIWISNDWHVALRWEIGLRVFLTKFMAMNFSFGMGGGPILSSGASSKF